MLTANELRIGNYIYDDYSGFMEVNSITNEYIDLFKIGYSAIGRFNINSIKPIPLTEEWLLKFGFTKTTGWDDMIFWFLDEDCDNHNRFELLETLNGYESPSEQIIKDVHILQNAYYFHTLTGKELTLKTT